MPRKPARSDIEIDVSSAPEAPADAGAPAAPAEKPDGHETPEAESLAPEPRTDVVAYFGLGGLTAEELDGTWIAVYRIEGGRQVRVNTLALSDVVELGDPEAAIASHGPGMYVLRPLGPHGRWVGQARRINISPEFARQHGWSPAGASPPPPPPPPDAGLREQIVADILDKVIGFAQKQYEEASRTAAAGNEERNVLLAALMKILSDRPQAASDAAVIMQALQAQSQQFQQAILQMMQAQQQHQQMLVEMQKHTTELQLNALKLFASRRESGADLAAIMPVFTQLLNQLSQRPETESLAVKLAREIIALSRDLSPEVASAAPAAGTEGGLLQTILQAVGPVVASKVLDGLMQGGRTSTASAEPSEEAPEMPTAPSPPPLAAQAHRTPPDWMARFRTENVVSALAACNPDAIRLVYLRNFKDALAYSADPDRIVEILLTVLPGSWLECVRSNPDALTFTPSDCDYFSCDATLAQATAQKLIEALSAGRRRAPLS